MEKHTPGPWYCWGGAVYRDSDQDNPTAPIAFMCRDERATAAGIYPVERDANAHFIVRAVNCHADLLAALERIAAAAGPFDDSHTPYWTINEDDITAARAAIARARGE